jgi:hypothetical protein
MGFFVIKNESEALETTGDSAGPARVWNRPAAAPARFARGIQGM